MQPSHKQATLTRTSLQMQSYLDISCDCTAEYNSKVSTILCSAFMIHCMQSCMCFAGDESVALGQHDLAAAAGLTPQMHLRGLATGLVSHDDSASLSETLDHNVEVAAVQNSLANMSMPQPRQESPAPESRLRSPQGAP